MVAQSNGAAIDIWYSGVMTLKVQATWGYQSL